MEAITAPARSNSPRRAACVASVLPLPGRARPIASVRQFIELAVNMPEQDPQVGQADSSMASSWSSDTDGSAEATIGSIRSSLRPSEATPASPAGAPASIGPPDTNTVGMFSRMVAISMPGVILSQFEMQIMASAQCAFTMYSTESAISSRLGSEYSIPPCPMAMPSSTAIVLNSRGIAPASRIAAATTWPTSRRCTCPGTNSVKLFATAMIGLPMSSRATPVARSRARAPAMFLPCVTVRDRSGGIAELLEGTKMRSTAYRPARSGRLVSPERRVRGLVDALDLARVERVVVTPPGPAAQVAAQPLAAEHVDVPDLGHVPGDLRPVHGHRRAHRDRAAQLRGQQRSGLAGLPVRVLEPVLHAVRPVPQLPVVAGPHRHPLVPVLGVDGEHARRADHQVVDLLLAVRDGQDVHGPVALTVQAGQLARGVLLGLGQPDPRRALEHRPRPDDGVGDRGQHGEGQPQAPVVKQETAPQPDHGRHHDPPLPGPPPRVRR